jgi:hypothetical protein
LHAAVLRVTSLWRWPQRRDRVIIRVALSMDALRFIGLFSKRRPTRAESRLFFGIFQALMPFTDLWRKGVLAG